MKEDDGDIGNEIDRNRITDIEAIGYCLGTVTTYPNSKKRGMDSQDKDEEELHEQAEIVLADSTVVWN